MLATSAPPLTPTRWNRIMAVKNLTPEERAAKVAARKLRQRETDRLWGLANPEKVRAKRERHKEHAKARQRARYRMMTDVERQERRAKKIAYQAQNKEHVRTLQRKSDRKYAEANRERLRLKNNTYHVANKERILSRKSAYYAANLERLRRAWQARYLANRDRFRLMARQYYGANREAVLEKARLNYPSIASRQLTYAKRWKAANPLRARAHGANRRARAQANGGIHTHLDIMRLLNLQKHRCAYCKKSVRAGYEVDHKVPLKRGGSNGPRNLAIACAPCNRTKAARDPIHFARSRGLLL